MTPPFNGEAVISPTDRILDAIEGAVIVAGQWDVEGEGMSLNFADGRILVFNGRFIVSLVRLDKDMRH